LSKIWNLADKMRKNGPQSTTLASRTIGFSIALAAFLSICPSNANAGMIVPWAHDSSSNRGCSAIDALSAGLEATDLDTASTQSSAPSGSPAKEPGDRPKTPRHESDFLADLAEGPGGASAPETSGSGSTSVTPAALAEFAVCESPANSYRRVREAALRLPQPPCEELMDPPKTRS
jgi:hypothetical protein